MSHYGIITPPVPGHIHPFAALGRALRQRGHRVTVFHMADLEAKISAEGLDFCVIGRGDHPPGHLPQSLQALGRLKGLAALRFTVEALKRTSIMFCREGPEAVREAKVDVLLVDQMEPAGGAIADRLGLPFLTICNALAINQDSSIPPPFAGWSYSNSLWARARNWAGYQMWRRMIGPVYAAVDEYRRQWGLPIHASVDAGFSRVAQISQQPPAFDYPRRGLPATFHYVGPLRFPGTQTIPFPWERLDGRPLIYASLGTLQNRTLELFRYIAEACEGLPAQLLISHGRGLSEEEVATLPGSPLVVPYAPQLEILAKARLTITHAGLNTVLDSLSHGVPMVAIPLTAEQPGIAARVAWTGAGTVIPRPRFTASLLRRSVQAILGSTAAYDAARRVAESIRQAGGVERAVKIIEEAG
jgi:zeaxanthin glucosyltransferase